MKTVLLEDDVILSRKWHSMLEESYDVCAVTHNATDFIQSCKSFQPSLVFIDLTIPIYSGLECFLSLKNELQNMPLSFLLTETNDEWQIRKAYQIGFNEIILKSFDENKILKIIQSSISSTRSPG
jgi:two-component system response regulator protein BraR/BceR